MSTGSLAKQICAMCCDIMNGAYSCGENLVMYFKGCNGECFLSPVSGIAFFRMKENDVRLLLILSKPNRSVAISG